MSHLESKIDVRSAITMALRMLRRHMSSLAPSDLRYVHYVGSHRGHENKMSWPALDARRRKLDALLNKHQTKAPAPPRPQVLRRRAPPTYKRKKLPPSAPRRVQRARSFFVRPAAQQPRLRIPTHAQIARQKKYRQVKITEVDIPEGKYDHYLDPADRDMEDVFTADGVLPIVVPRSTQEYFEEPIPASSFFDDHMSKAEFDAIMEDV